MTISKKLLAAAGITAALVLTACTPAAQTTPSADAPTGDLTDVLSEMDPVTLSLADIANESSADGRALARFAELVEERTNGKVSFELYFSSSLMPGTEMLSGIGTGTASTGRLITSYFPAEMPVANWVLGLGSTSSTSFPHGLLQGAASAHEAFTTFEPLTAELDALNVVPLYAHVPSQQYDLLCVDPVETLADTQGIRSRTLGATWVSEVEALGMTAVPLPVTEMYEGLQRGVVDCVVLQVPGHIDYSLWEVAKNYVPVSLSQLNGLVFVMNKDVWQDLPPEVQSIVRGAAHEAWILALENALERYAVFATEGVEDFGVVFNDPRELDEVLSAHQSDVVDGLTDAAPAGTSPSDIQDYLDAQERWLSVLVDDLAIPLVDRDPTRIQQSFAEAADINLAEFAEVTRTQAFGLGE